MQVTGRVSVREKVQRPVSASSRQPLQAATPRSAPPAYPTIDQHDTAEGREIKRCRRSRRPRADDQRAGFPGA